MVQKQLLMSRVRSFLPAFTANLQAVVKFVEINPFLSIMSGSDFNLKPFSPYTLDNEKISLLLKRYGCSGGNDGDAKRRSCSV
jgi:hypothetical protein